MQDVIPPRRNSRGTITVPARVDMRTRQMPVKQEVFTRQTRIINDVMPNQEAVVTETLVTTYDTNHANLVRGAESLSAQEKSAVLQKALLSAQRELRKERRKQRDLKRFSLVLIASLLVLVTGYVSIDTWLTNKSVQAELTATGGFDEEKAAEGKDETVPDPASLGLYTVAPDLPRVLHIDKLDIAARILPMGVNRDNSIKAPKNIFDAGWYTGSVKPGEIGAMFIDAHASGLTREGLFAYLDKLEIGDEIQIEKGDGSRLTYRVVHTETADLESVDMRKMLLPYGNALRGLNLMTCAGDWIADQETYNQRVMVWTEQV